MASSSRLNVLQSHLAPFDSIISLSVADLAKAIRAGHLTAGAYDGHSSYSDVTVVTVLWCASFIFKLQVIGCMPVWLRHDVSQ